MKKRSSRSIVFVFVIILDAIVVIVFVVVDGGGGRPRVRVLWVGTGLPTRGADPRGVGWRRKGRMNIRRRCRWEGVIGRGAVDGDCGRAVRAADGGVGVARRVSDSEGGKDGAEGKARGGSRGGGGEEVGEGEAERGDF